MRTTRVDPSGGPESEGGEVPVDVPRNLAVQRHMERRSKQGLRRLAQQVAEDLESPLDVETLSSSTVDELAAVIVRMLTSSEAPLELVFRLLNSPVGLENMRVDSKAMERLSVLAGSRERSRQGDPGELEVLMAIRGILGNQSPAGSALDALMESDFRQWALDEIIDRGLAIPDRLARDDYVRARQGLGDSIPHHLDCWDHTQELEQLLDSLDRGADTDLARLKELTYAQWPEQLNDWAKGEASVEALDSSLAEREGLWRYVRARAARLTPDQIRSVDAFGTSKVAYILWSAYGDVAAALKERRWRDAREATEAAHELSTTAVTPADTIRFLSVLGLLDLVHDDPSSAADRFREAGEIELGEEGVAALAATNHHIVAAARRGAAIELVSPYLLLGCDEGSAAFASSRLRLLRLYPGDREVAMAVNGAHARLTRPGRRSREMACEWVKLPPAYIPRVRHGLTWSLPRTTRPIGSAEVDVLEDEVAQRVRIELARGVEIRVANGWLDPKDFLGIEETN